MTTTTSNQPHVPEGYHSVTPWMIGHDTAGLIDFLVRVFDATELARVVDDRGQIGHAEVRIGDSVVMMFDNPDWPPTPAFLRLYVADAAAAHDRVVAAGGKSVTKPTHVFWGDITSRVSDPFGNLYWINQRIEDVSEEEMVRRMSDPVFATNLEYVQSSVFRPAVD